MSFKVLLLTGPRDYQRFAADRLAERLDITQIVVEDASLRKPKESETTSVKDRLRNLSPGLFSALARVKQQFTRTAAERRTLKILESLEESAGKEFEAAIGRVPEWPSDVPRKHVPRINGKEVVSLCQELTPDVTIVFGTGILKTPMIRVGKTATLNAHTSLLPNFRGTSSEFWQVQSGRLDCAGVTVHYIDEGVDTGELLLQQPTRIEGVADPYRLRLHNVLMVPEMFVEAVELLERGEAPRIQQGTSDLPTYRTKDLTLERQIEMVRALGHDV